MKKILLSFASAIVLLSLMITCTLAHSGRTDSNGGHWDRSSGEYHYHHGCSAHDHYDIDGDGHDDCPYDFKENKWTESNEESLFIQIVKAFFLSVFISVAYSMIYVSSFVGLLIVIVENFFFRLLRLPQIEDVCCTLVGAIAIFAISLTYQMLEIFNF